MAARSFGIPSSLQRALADLLRSFQWREDRDFDQHMRGAQCFFSPKGAEFCMILEGDLWEMGESGSIASEAGGSLGRYRTVESGQGLESMDEAIQGRTQFLILDQAEEERAEWEYEYQADLYDSLHPEERCPARE